MNSELLQHLVDIKKVPLDIAQWADQYPTPELQSEAIHLLRDDQAQSKTRIEAVMREKMTASPQTPTHAPDPASHGAGAFGALTHMPKGHVRTALHSMEKVAGWDIVNELEERLNEHLPYRAARRVFGWACMAFTPEMMLAVMIGGALLYGGFVGVRWTVRKVSSSEFLVASSQNSKLVTSNSMLAVPTGLSPERLSADRVRFRWNPVPGSTGYNLYSAHGNQGFARENQDPVTEPHLLWGPGSGPDIYRIAITAVDAQGHESGKSEAVSVDMREPQ